MRVSLRTAAKIVRQATPGRVPMRKLLRAISRLGRLRCEPENCLDCPQPSPGCPNGKTCNRSAEAFSLAMAIETGQHPWGDWKCLMQRAAEGEDVTTEAIQASDRFVSGTATNLRTGEVHELDCADGRLHLDLSASTGLGRIESFTIGGVELLHPSSALSDPRNLP